MRSFAFVTGLVRVASFHTDDLGVLSSLCHGYLAAAALVPYVVDVCAACGDVSQHLPRVADVAPAPAVVRHDLKDVVSNASGSADGPLHHLNGVGPTEGSSGAAVVAGGSDWARSTDGGETWTLEGTILPRTDSPRATNALKLSISPEGAVFAYGSRAYPLEGHGFGHVRNEPVFCTFDGVGWSSPTTAPMPVYCLQETFHGILPLSSDRLLAPAATLPAESRLGEQVLIAISYDGGRSWPRHAVVFQDPAKKVRFFEHKLPVV